MFYLFFVSPLEIALRVARSLGLTVCCTSNQEINTSEDLVMAAPSWRRVSGILTRERRKQLSGKTSASASTFLVVSATTFARSPQPYLQKTHATIDVLSLSLSLPVSDEGGVEVVHDLLRLIQMMRRATLQALVIVEHLVAWKSLGNLFSKTRLQVLKFDGCLLGKQSTAQGGGECEAESR